jgi:hypothetical protein
MFIVCMLDYFFKVMEQFWKQVQLVYKYLIPLFEGKNFFELFFLGLLEQFQKARSCMSTNVWWAIPSFVKYMGAKPLSKFKFYL